MPRLLKRALLLATLSAVLTSLLLVVRVLVTERASRRDAVTQEVSSSFGQAQVVRGPFVTVRSVGPNGAETHHTLGPKALEVTADVDVDARYRGIYEVPVYVSRQHLHGTFSIPKELAAGTSPDGAQLVVQVSDAAGVRVVPRARIDGVERAFEPGAQSGHPGMHLALPELARGGGELVFDIDLELQGTRELAWAPLADSATVRVRSPWRHPSFVGQTLPAERRVSDAGFEAEWKTHPFMSVGPPQTRAVSSAHSGSAPQGPTVGVAFLQPVDLYAQVDRSVKYGFLFVTLTFGAFFLFEALRRLPIHPVQYAMIGAALTLFFVLLLSLSEHIAFAQAYAVAASACVGLITFYLRWVLGGVVRALSFGVVIAGLYGALFVLLRAEDLALLLGSGLLLVILAAAMVLTRRLDWSRVWQQGDDEPAPPPGPACARPPATVLPVQPPPYR